MLNIYNLTDNNFTEEDFLSFFSNYNLETFYRLNLDIELEKFKKFLVYKLRRRINAKNGDFWMIRNENNIIATFGLEKEQNSSLFYEKNIYNLSSFYNFTEFSKEAFNIIKNKIDEYQRINSIDYIKCKVDLSDHKNIYYLLEEHFHYYASSQKIYFDRITCDSPKKITKARFKVRNFIRETDLDSCLMLLEQHNQNEKFYNHNFSIESTHIIFKEWFLNQIKNNNSTILVLCDAVNDNKIIGLSIYTRPKQFNELLDINLITWDIAVLDKDMRGNGLTTLLFSEMASKENANIEGSTMSDNLILQKFAHKFGFFIVGTFVYLGKKYY